MFSRAVWLVALVVAGVLAPAGAASATTTLVRTDAGVYSLFESSAADDLVISSEIGFAPDPGRFIFTDEDGVTVLGPVAQDACTADADTVECDATGVNGIAAVLGGGDDSLVASFIFGPSTELEVDGGSGIDTITGEQAADTIDGGTGDDIISGGGGANIIDGEAGEDTITGGTGADRVNGGTENDTLTGANGNDNLQGDDGNDVISGGEGVDTIGGDAGNDSVTAGPENDSIDGGAGTGDRIRYDEFNRSGGVIVTLDDDGTGSDGGAGETSESAFGFERVTGTARADQIGGDAQANVLDGGAGDDRLTGLAGDDTLSGAAGADTLDGGTDGDLLDGGANTDTGDYSTRSDALAISVGDAANGDGGVQDGAVGARDRVLTVETLLGGSGNDVLGSTEASALTLRGNGGDDTLSGGALDDLLVGGAGADAIAGGAGNDTTSYSEPERGARASP